MPPKTPYDTNALVKQTQDMLAQTKAQGATAFAGSTYDTPQSRVGAVQAITPSAMTPAQPIVVPPPPQTTLPNTSGATAQITANNASVAPPAPTPDTGTSLLDKYMKELGGNAQPNSAQTYLGLETNANISGLTSNAQADNNALSVAQQKLQASNAQIQALNNEAQNNQMGIPLEIQQQAQEGGANVTKGGLAPIQTAALRNAAIDNWRRAVPLQAQTLANQAEVAAAQGKAQLSQAILQQAQDHIDKLYGFQMEDAKAQYNYKTNLIDKAYEYASGKEKDALAVRQREEDRKFTLKQGAINNQQVLSRLALETNQGALSGKIASLDPNSPTFNTDLAKLQSQIQAKVAQKALEAPTVKTINGVDMQWNAQSGKWEEIPAGMSGGTPENIRKGQDATNLVLKTIKNLENTELTDASGRSTGRKLIQGFFYGQGDYGDLVAETNTLRTNMLVMQTDPSIKKFFGPQMSNADVQLMTSAGTTLNPELQSPEKLKEEVTRIKDLTIRASMAVQGVTQYSTTPSGIRVGLFPDGTIKDVDGNLYNSDGKRI